MKKRVVVTGAGIISPIGEDWPAIYAALQAKQNAVQVMDEWVANPKIRSKLAAPAIRSRIFLGKRYAAWGGLLS